MPYSLLPTLLMQMLIVGYTPGPANIYSLAMSLRYGRKKSLMMWLGLTVFSTFVLPYCVANISSRQSTMKDYSARNR